MSSRRSRAHMALHAQARAVASASLPSSVPSSTSPSTPTPLPSRVLNLAEVVVTVRTTESASATATSSAKVNLPVGAIAGGTVAGVLVVIFAGLFWWWWVANKPRELTPEERQARRQPVLKTAPGVVPQSVSTTRASGSKNPYSEKAVPLSSMGSSPTRSTSGTPLLAASASESSIALPVINKHAPVKPSPLATSRMAASVDENSTYPKWGEVPFVARPLAPFGESSQQSAAPQVQETYYEASAGSSNGFNPSDPRLVEDPFAEGSASTESYPQEKVGYLTVDPPAGDNVRRTSNMSAVSEGSVYSNADEGAYNMASVNSYSGQQRPYQQHAPPYDGQRL